MAGIAVSVLLVILSIALSLLDPKKGASALSLLSFDDFGVRKIARWNNTTDSVGNFFLFFSLLFCVGYFLIPNYEIFYSLWLAFTFLCTLAQSFRVCKRMARWKSFLVVIMVCLIASAGLLCGLGLLNGRIFVYPIYQFKVDLTSHVSMDLWYPFFHYDIPYTILQGMILFMPLFALWQQFKYMRLEDHYKASFLFTYVLKNIIWIALMIFLSVKGFEFINLMYRVQYVSE
jgi:hypothetical protein